MNVTATAACEGLQITYASSLTLPYRTKRAEARAPLHDHSPSKADSDNENGSRRYKRRLTHNWCIIDICENEEKYLTANNEQERIKRSFLLY